MERLEEQCWHILASLGDAIDNERKHTDYQWKMYMNEIHSWLSEILTSGGDKNE
jgi:hypothetical protein